VSGETNIKKLDCVHLKFYQRYPNIGDQFSPAVARHFFSDNVVGCDGQALSVPNLILVGSFLHYADALSHVCGTGFISAEPKYLLRTAPQAVYCVRGPLTGHLLKKQGVKAPALYGDPGILAPLIYPQPSHASATIGLIPHYRDAGSEWVQRCRDRGVRIIDVFAPPERFFAELNQCGVILSSSLHGIIFAHAYGKQALWVELSSNVIGDGFKFYDYYASLGMRPDTVQRVRAERNTDPYAIAALARPASHAMLRAWLQEGIERAIHQLESLDMSASSDNVVRQTGFVTMRAGCN
jgi:pyruvyltransferase